MDKRKWEKIKNPKKIKDYGLEIKDFEE